MDTIIKIEPVVAGEPIFIVVEFPDEHSANAAASEINELPVNVIARYRTLPRHQLSTTLKIDPDRTTCFRGKVETARGTGKRTDAEEHMLRVRAGDTVAVQLEDGPKTEAVAMGISVDDIVAGETLHVVVADDVHIGNKVPQVVVTVTNTEGEKKSSAHALLPVPNLTNRYSVMIETYDDEEADVPENWVLVQDKDRVTFVYERPDGTKMSWQVNVFSIRKVDLKVTGGVSQGEPIEVLVVDADRADESSAAVFAYIPEKEKVIEKRLEKVERSNWMFSGMVLTASRPAKGLLAVETSDAVEIFYLDARYTFHRTDIDILEPAATFRELAWQKKYCVRAFFMPSLKPLLAALNCMEVRLNYYRSTASTLSKKHRIDLLANDLKRAEKTLNSNRWDLTPAWETLHDAKQQEVYLLRNSEVEGEKHRILADSKLMVSPEHRTRIEALLKRSEQKRKKEPGTNRWRGFIVGAMKILHEQQDAYFIRQNMIRDRMMLMTIFLAIFLFGFFSIQWNSNVADALVNNRTIQEIFTTRTPLAHGLGEIADDKKADIHFVGETIISQPLVLAVYDHEVENEDEVSVVLRCTKETASFCPDWQDAYLLNRVPGRKGWYRFILETEEGDPGKNTPGVLVFKPGAEVIATYERDSDPKGEQKEVLHARTRMLDSNWFPTINLDSGMVVIAACLLGAIGACLSTLMDLRSGNQVPNYLDSIMVTFVRPVIGFTAALLLFISLNAKLLSFDPTLTMYWLLCFISGFSDRLVLGVVSKIDGSGREGK